MNWESSILTGSNLPFTDFQHCWGSGRGLIEIEDHPEGWYRHISGRYAIQRPHSRAWGANHARTRAGSKRTTQTLTWNSWASSASPWWVALQPQQHRSSEQTAEFIFIRRDTPHRLLQPPYMGPYRVLEKNPKFFKVQCGNWTETVSIDCLKPANTDPEHPVRPAQPPTRGRLPRANPPLAAMTTPTTAGPDRPDEHRDTYAQTTRSGRTVHHPARFEWKQKSKAFSVGHVMFFYYLIFHITFCMTFRADTRGGHLVVERAPVSCVSRRSTADSHSI